MKQKINEVTQFQKLVLLGITLALILLTTVIITLASKQRNYTPPVHENIINEQAISPKAQTDQHEIHDSHKATQENNTNGNDENTNEEVSMGTRVGEMWVSGSDKVWSFLTDFDDVVNVTGFFRTGYIEFYDAVRADSDEEFTNTIVQRFAKDNDVTIVDIEIIDNNSVKLKASSENEASAKNFCRDLENLSFISEATYLDSGIDNDGLFVINITIENPEHN